MRAIEGPILVGGGAGRPVDRRCLQNMFVTNNLGDVVLTICDAVNRVVVGSRRMSVVTTSRMRRFGQIWCNVVAYLERISNV